jgi:hypothetical protein
MKQLVAKTLCLGAVIGMVSSAQAITYTFNATQTSILPTVGTSAWTIVLDTADNVLWKINSITAAPGQTPGNVNAITFTFYDDTFTGNTIFGVANPGAPGTFGNVNGGSPAWTYDDSPGVTFVADTSSNILSANNIFTGQFSLASANAQSFVVSLQGNPHQWQGKQALIPIPNATATLTPELPGSALLGVALLPLGLMLRKRMA